MLKGDDIKRFVKEAEDWQVEFKLAKGGVPDMFWESYSVIGKTVVKNAVKSGRKGEFATKVAVKDAVKITASRRIRFGCVRSVRFSIALRRSRMHRCLNIAAPPTVANGFSWFEVQA